MAARSQSFYPSAPSSSSTIPCNYDVFLSFRGVDTRKNFTGHLYTRLVDTGVTTFIDDEELDKGENISLSIPDAIQKSKISIIIFSRNYASSTWCLRELVKILECRTEPIQQKVLPIFLDGADPSDIRKQAGSFAEAFRRHEKRFERKDIDRWTSALREAANLSGYAQKDIANGQESGLIQTVVDWVLNYISPIIPLDVTKYPVGIDSHVRKMMKLLDYPNAESKHIQIVGICGMGGIGKTTIAKAVYNQICCSFEGSSFLEDVGGVSKQPKGLVCLQKQLLSDIIKQNISIISKINNVSRGKGLIRKLQCAKKVLVVLDNVDENDQLKALADEVAWFGLGSLVIITSRDKRVLSFYPVKENEIYEPKELNFHQSLQLFSNYAFRRSYPLDDYKELARKVVNKAGGLPLALEVVGSSLFNGRKEWESSLEELEKIPPLEVKKKLKISYDALEHSHKEIFIDIACFFIGSNKEYAYCRLESCYPSFNLGICILIEKSLVKIGEDNVLRMHGMVRDMGREIVKEESPLEPWKRSRLWFHEEALRVLKKCKGKTSVKGMLINFDQENETVAEKCHFSTETFSEMENLRLLWIDGAHLVGDSKHLPSELRCLSWRRCPLEFIPINKLFAKVEVLDLSCCCFLTGTPHFSGLPNVKILNLAWCEKLVEVHESIGNLKKLSLGSDVLQKYFRTSK